MWLHWVSPDSCPPLPPAWYFPSLPINESLSCWLETGLVMDRRQIRLQTITTTNLCISISLSLSLSLSAAATQDVSGFRAPTSTQALHNSHSLGYFTLSLHSQHYWLESLVSALMKGRLWSARHPGRELPVQSSQYNAMLPSQARPTHWGPHHHPAF